MSAEGVASAGAGSGGAGASGTGSSAGASGGNAGGRVIENPEVFLPAVFIPVETLSTTATPWEAAGKSSVFQSTPGLGGDEINSDSGRDGRPPAGEHPDWEE